ncbi:MAG: hypothetical protein M1831_002567 [Alyxoria varia]|nr:MAG: hypothetical protein M1831_002567 [Alyxoria varia]
MPKNREKPKSSQERLSRNELCQRARQPSTPATNVNQNGLCNEFPGNARQNSKKDGPKRKRSFNDATAFELPKVKHLKPSPNTNPQRGNANSSVTLVPWYETLKQLEEQVKEQERRFNGPLQFRYPPGPDPPSEEENPIRSSTLAPWCEALNKLEVELNLQERRFDVASQNRQPAQTVAHSDDPSKLETGMRSSERRGPSSPASLPSFKYSIPKATLNHNDIPEAAPILPRKTPGPLIHTMMQRHKKDYSLMTNTALRYYAHCGLKHEQISRRQMKKLVRRMASYDLQHMFAAVESFDRKNLRQMPHNTDRLVTNSEIQSLKEWYHADGGGGKDSYLKQFLTKPRELLDGILTEAKRRKKQLKKMRGSKKVRELTPEEPRTSERSPSQRLDMSTQLVGDTQSKAVEQSIPKTSSQMPIKNGKSGEPTVIKTKSKRRRKPKKEDETKTELTPVKESNNPSKIVMETPLSTHASEPTTASPGGLPQMMSDRSSGPSSHFVSPKTPQKGESLGGIPKRHPANDAVSDSCNREDDSGLEDEVTFHKRSNDPHKEHLLRLCNDDYKTKRTRREKAICADLRMSLGEMEYARLIESGELVKRVKEKKEKRKKADKKKKLERQQVVNESKAAPEELELDFETSKQPIPSPKFQRQEDERSTREDTLSHDDDTSDFGPSQRTLYSSRMSPHRPGPNAFKGAAREKLTNEESVLQSKEYLESPVSPESPKPAESSAAEPRDSSIIEKKTAKTQTVKKGPIKSPYFPVKKTAKPKPKKSSKSSLNVDGSNKSASVITKPPIVSKSFGLIQEKYTRKPFYLLLACLFLNRTKSKAALNCFFAIEKKFPTVEELTYADARGLYRMIEHLGLGHQRSKIILGRALIWLGLRSPENSDVDDPLYRKTQGKAETRLGHPKRGLRYRTLNYPVPGAGHDIGKDEVVGDEEGMESVEGFGSQDHKSKYFPTRFTAINSSKPAIRSPAKSDTRSATDPDPRSGAFEIYYMPGIGRYAMDSWRIFCRDDCRGVATDYDGGRAGKKALELPVDDDGVGSSSDADVEDGCKRQVKIVKPGEPEWPLCCRGIEEPTLPNGSQMAIRRPKSYLPADWDIVVPVPRPAGTKQKKGAPTREPTMQPLVQQPTITTGNSLRNARNDKPLTPPFEPEWKRVLPHDKELRAYLKWMWKRDGWRWDPYTGHRVPLALAPAQDSDVEE